jgi:hypothetical protein
MNSLRALLLAFGTSVALLGAPVDRLAQGFDAPPTSARPQTFWHWMNGNVTPEGITLDLEAMARIGVSGVMIFDGSDYLPAGPVNYLDPKWRALMQHAFKEGRRLGIQVGLHNGPGWSSSGGPWVQPAQSMQQLVWTETTVAGGQRLVVDLARPQTNLGHYRDAYVIAFPALPAERVPDAEALAFARIGPRTVDTALLRDGKMETALEISPDAPLLLEYREPVELHGVTAFPGASGRLPRLTVEVSEDGRRFTPATTVGAPARHGILAPAVRAFPPVTARFVRVTPSAKGDLGEFTLHRAPRIADWVAKANFDYRVTGQLAVPGPTPPGAAIDPAQVVDLTSRLRGDRLEWDAPAGAWTILRIGHTSTGKTNVAASAAGRGLEIDKFNAGATEFHFRSVVERVAAEAEAAGAPGPAFVTIDSYEAGMQNWTADFPAEFRRRVGYDLLPYLPALFGRFVGDAGIAERFLADFRRVQADLMAERYYERMHELTRDRGLTFYVEGYGTGNFDELRISGLADVPLTEFWTRTPWTPNRVVKMVTSAAHVYGKRVVGAEAFTGEFRTSRWLEYPYALKILGDDVSAQGVNHFVFHRSVHQPHPTAAPGISLGPYGFFFERTNTWFSQAKPWLDYLTRVHWMLQQGTYAADVLYFTGERSPEPSQFALPVVPRGYTYDLVNPDVVLRRLRVVNGDYVLPDGGRYKLLVLPPDLRALRPETVAKLREFVAAGGMLVGPKPRFSPTLQGYPESERRMLAQVDELWDHPRVLATASIAEALRKRGVTPDVTWTGREPDAELSWQHRRLEDGDLFFLSNRQRRPEEVVVSFRGMAGRQPEIWRPETGERGDAVVFARNEDRVEVPLQLDPGEAVFVLFRRPVDSTAGTNALRRDGLPALSTELPLVKRAVVAGDFTMAMWVKPDTDLRVFPNESTTGRIDETGKFYAIPADPGDVRFGAGHATAGLAVGRNGIFVVERATDSSPAVLAWRGPVSGWTHVAVVYRAGTPHLYVNGALVRRGLRSGKTVHSGVGAPPPPVDYVLNFPAIESLTRSAGQPPPPSRGQVYFFEGNSVPPTEHARPLDEAEIRALAEAGLPPPPLPVVTALRRTGDATRAVAWASGRYTLDGRGEQTVEVPQPRALDGGWHVAFEAGRGAPESIDLPELRSLHLHADPGVKYFAGTARYSRQLDVPAEWIARDRRIVLDLGRVEVIAEVWVNGKFAGSAWKEPYRVDVTDAVHAGANALEVRVATLWPNRLIGDEFLPPENEYGLRDEQGNDPHGIVKLPEWYRTGQPKPPGGRVTFSAWNFYSKDEPLVASGLLGPVRLLNPVEIEFR